MISSWCCDRCTDGVECVINIDHKSVCISCVQGHVDELRVASVKAEQRRVVRFWKGVEKHLRDDGEKAGATEVKFHRQELESLFKSGDADPLDD